MMTTLTGIRKREYIASEKIRSARDDNGMTCPMIVT